MPEPMKQQLAVEIDRNLVTVKIHCTDRYAAIELYEKLCQSAREGFVEPELETVPRG